MKKIRLVRGFVPGKADVLNGDTAFDLVEAKLNALADDGYEVVAVTRTDGEFTLWTMGKQVD